jgi:hypothetical protein
MKICQEEKQHCEAALQPCTSWHHFQSSELQRQQSSKELQFEQLKIKDCIVTELDLKNHRINSLGNSLRSEILVI